MPAIDFDVDAFLLKHERPRDRAVMDLLEFARREERRTYAPDLLDDPVHLQSDKDIAWGRYNGTLKRFVPWLVRLLNGATPSDVIEIGGGTGSSAAAFSHFCGSVVSYDFDEHSLSFGRERCTLMGVRNVEFQCATALGEICTRHADGVDGVLLFAVLEHMTAPERLNTLSVAWDLLRPGGFILIAETPNRLAYLDHHTSGLPFFNMLPEELALRYIDRTERSDVKLSLDLALRDGLDAAKLALVRSGYSGVSYHEFEIAMGYDYSKYIISHPSDPELTGVYGDFSPEQTALSTYSQVKNLGVHPSFFEAYLSIVFRKPCENE